MTLLTTSVSIHQSEMNVKRRFDNDPQFLTLTNQQLIQKARMAIEHLNPQFTNIVKQQTELLN